MKSKNTSRSQSSSNEIGIFVFLTLVIFFGAVGFPTLINTSPTIGYDENTIAKLTPVTTYYQQAFAEEQEMNILSAYYFDPNIISAYMLLPITVDLPPPDMVSYFMMKYGQGIDLEYGFIEFDTIQELFTPKNNFLDINNYLPSAFADHSNQDVSIPIYHINDGEQATDETNFFGSLDGYYLGQQPPTALNNVSVSAISLYFGGTSASPASIQAVVLSNVTVGSNIEDIVVEGVSDNTIDVSGLTEPRYLNFTFTPSIDLDIVVGDTFLGFNYTGDGTNVANWGYSGSHGNDSVTINHTSASPITSAGSFDLAMEVMSELETPVPNLSVSTGISPANLVVYHSFDNSSLALFDEGGIKPYSNAGTFAHNSTVVLIDLITGTGGIVSLPPAVTGLFGESMNFSGNIQQDSTHFLSSMKNINDFDFIMDNSTTDWGMSFWINSSSFTTIGVGSFLPIINSMGILEDSGIRIMVDSNEEVVVDIANSDGLVLEDLISTSTSLTDNNWQHIGITMDKTDVQNANVTLYINGTGITSQTVDLSSGLLPLTEPFNNNPQVLSIGTIISWDTKGEEYIPVQIDDLGIWSGYLPTDADMLAIYNSTVGATIPTAGSGTTTDQEASDFAVAVDSVSVSIVANEDLAPVSQLNATLNESTGNIELSWLGGGNATGFKILRASSETGDEIRFDDYNGLSDPSQPQIGAICSSPLLLANQFYGMMGNSNFGQNGATTNGEIPTSVQMKAGITTSSIRENYISNCIVDDVRDINSPDFFGSCLVNSTSFYNGEELVVSSSGQVLDFEYRGEGLYNMSKQGSPFSGSGKDGIVTTGFCNDENTAVGSSIRVVGATEPATERWNRVDARNNATVYANSGSATTAMDLYVINRTQLETGNTDSALVLDSGSNATTHIDTSVIEGESYFYRVVPINSTTEGGSSPIANSTTLYDPVTPVGTVATTLTDTSIGVSWNFANGNDGYTLQRSLDNVTFANLVNLTGIPNNNHTDTGLSSGTEYFYRVLGFIQQPVSGLFVNSSASLHANATTSGAPVPDQVTGLTIIQDMKNEASLDWDNATNADNYQILVNTTFASSVGNVNANSTWQFREYHSTSGFPSSCDITSTTEFLRLNSFDGGGAKSNCKVWKTLPRELLNNTKVEIKYEGISGGVGGQLISAQVYGVNEPNQFPESSDDSFVPDTGAIPPRGAPQGFDLITFGSLTHDGGILVEQVPVSWASADDSDYIEFVLSLTDSNIISNSPQFRIYYLNFTDLDTGSERLFYNFSSSSITKTSRGGSCDDAGAPVPHKLQCDYGFLDVSEVRTPSSFEVIGTSLTSDFNYTETPLSVPQTYFVRANNSAGFGANSTEVEFGLIQPVTDLIATGTNQTAITLNWTLATTVHPSDPLTGVIIQSRDAVPLWYDGFTADDFADSTESVRVGSESMMGYMQEVYVDESFEIDTMTIRLKEGTLTTGQSSSTFSAFVVTDPEINDTPATMNSKLLVNSTNNFDSDLLTNKYQEFIFTFPTNTIPKGFHGFGVEFNNFHDMQVLPELQDTPDWITSTKGLPAGNSSSFSIGIQGCNQDIWKLQGCGSGGKDFVGINIAGNGFTNNFAGETPIFSTRDFGDWTTLATVDDLDTSYVDNSLTADTSKSYRVKGSSAVSTGAFLAQEIPSSFGVASNTTDASVTPPEPITDLQVILGNTTTIMEGGVDTSVEDVDLYPAMMLQTINVTQPTLIDSFRLRIQDDSVIGNGGIGTITGVIIGDRTGDLDFNSLLEDIYFIENSTQTISSSQVYPSTHNFNFSGNTILDADDGLVGIGIVISNHTNEIRMAIDVDDGTGLTQGNSLFLGNICGSLTVFERDSCNDAVEFDDLADLEIFGGNARAILNWTAPADNGDAITGYNVLRANATQKILWDEEAEINGGICDDRCENIGSFADPIGFVGQRITFPTDVQLTDIMLNLIFKDNSPFGGSMDIRGVILKDAPVGTGSFTSVANSTFVKLGKAIGGDILGGNPATFNTFNNKSPEAFTFNNTILTAGVEYIIGVESFGSFSGSDIFQISHNGTTIPTSPNNGLGVFTKLHVGTSDLWENNSTQNLNAMFMGLNYTEEIADTGNTNVEYTSTADFPSADSKINAYEYLVKAINSGGNANASNTADISPDRSGFDLWDYREHDTRTFFSPSCAFGSNDENVFAINFTGATPVGFCDVFKSFNKTEITGSDIGINVNFTQNGRIFFQIIDGNYDKDEFNEFPLNDGHPSQVIGKNIKGIGLLNSTDSFFIGTDQCDLTHGDAGAGLRQCDVVIPASGINYAGSTEDEISVFLKLFAGRSAVGNIEISNVGSWDFTNNPRKVIGIDNGASLAISLGASENQDDRGNLYSNGIFQGNVTIGGANSTQTETDIVTVIDLEQLVIDKTNSDTVTVNEDVVITPPTIPEGITDLTGNTVLATCELGWSEPVTTSAINGYRILRQVDGGGYSILIANTSTTATSNIDTGLISDVLYEYDVRAGNRFGFANVSSNIVDCMPIVSQIPSPPLSLDATNVGQNVKLTWTDSLTGDPTGYQVQRKIGSLGSYITIVNDTGSLNPKQYTDTTVSPQTEYVYKIASWNSFGLSDFSNEATITTPSLPASPTLTGEQIGDVIVLNWTEPATGNPINGYKIDRRINGGSLSVYIANTTDTSLSFVDSNVTKPDTFGYRVRALTNAGEGVVSNVIDIVFGSHVIVHVREQDSSGFKGGGFVKGENSTFSNLIGLNVNSDAIFDNLAVGNYNYTFNDDDSFILNKTFNFPAPAGNDTSEFTINALVFDVDCPDNGVGADVRIKVNYTDAKDIVSFPSTPVCDSTDQVSWSTRWVGENVTDASTMVADFISTVFMANAEQFLASSDIIPTIYNSGNNQIESDAYQVNSTDVTINFNLFMGRAPAGGGGGGGGGTPPFQSIPELQIVLEQKLTGLSLLSRTHGNVMAGDVIEGAVTVEWEGEQGLSVTDIDVGEFSDIIRFEIPPFPIDQEIEGIGDFALSAGEIPYVITVPPFICDEALGISQNCITEELFTLPIQFEFESEGVTYQAETTVMIDLRPIPFDLPQFQIILLGIVLLVSAIAGNFIRHRIRGKSTPSGKSRTRKKRFKKKFDSS